MTDLTLVDPFGPIAAQASAMRGACETLGFFAIPLDSIDRSIADAAWETAAAFFSLPESDKRKIAFPEPGYPYGYSPFRYETLAKSLDERAARPDLKESLSVGPDCASVCAPAGPDPTEAWIRSPSLWPDEPTELRAAWSAYYRALTHVAERLMQIMAVALGLPAGYFASMIDRPITSMRAIHYPELSGSFDVDGALRAGAHSDYGTLTILRTDGVPGLEIRQPDGGWVPVATKPDRFIVNLGDSIAQWTNDRWRSTVHRVAVTDRSARQSFAFFHMANWDAVIECLPTCRVEGEPPRHAPAQAGPWLMSKFTSTVAG